MGLKVPNYFNEENYEAADLKIICCKKCLSHLCLSSFVASNEFTGKSGQAYLVNKLINFEFYDSEVEEKMITGTYLIQKVKCHQCKSKLGWFYKKSYDHREMYKEGKFVIELAYLKFFNNTNSTKKLIDKVNKQKLNKTSSSCSTSPTSSIKSNESTSSHNPIPIASKLFRLKNDLNSSSNYNNLIINWKYKSSNKNPHYGDIHNGVFLSRIINTQQHLFNQDNNDEIVDESLVDDEEDEIFIDT